MTLIIKAGSTLAVLKAARGDFEDWVIAGLGVDHSSAIVVDVTTGERLPAVGKHDRIVITGSHSMVTDRLAWSERAAEWIRAVHGAGIPTLGICYGHQLIAHALGGLVDDNPRGPEYGTATISLSADAGSDPLLAGLPPTIAVHASHTQSALRLPAGAVRLAFNDREQNHVVRFGPASWGLQFHPEFDAGIMRGYLEHNREALRTRGTDVDALVNRVQETPGSAAVLKRFMTLRG